MIKINVIDIMKGISILMIVFFHLVGQLHLDLDKSVRMLTYQGVNVFFCLSGFTLFLSLNHTQQNKDLSFWVQWIKTKFFRLSIAYYTVLLFTMFFYIINSNLLHISILSNNPILDFIVHLTYLHVFFQKYYYSINPAFWFIGVIFLFYLLVPFFYKIKNKYFYILIVLLFIYFYGEHLYALKPQITLSLIFFTFGILASCYSQEFIKHDIGFKFMFILIPFLVTIYFLKSDVGNGHIYILISFISLCSIYMISIIIESVSNKFNVIAILNTILTYFGKISFFIYLIHWGLIKPIFTFTDNYYIGIILYSFVVVFLSIMLIKFEKFVIKIMLK